jgi:hypothetical protein
MSEVSHCSTFSKIRTFPHAQVENRDRPATLPGSEFNGPAILVRQLANAPTFENIDTNGDGEISAAEFDAHKAEMMEKRQQRTQ